MENLCQMINPVIFLSLFFSSSFQCKIPLKLWVNWCTRRRTKGIMVLLHVGEKIQLESRQTHAFFKLFLQVTFSIFPHSVSLCCRNFTTKDGMCQEKFMGMKLFSSFCFYLNTPVLGYSKKNDWYGLQRKEHEDRRNFLQLLANFAHLVWKREFNPISIMIHLIIFYFSFLRHRGRVGNFGDFSLFSLNGNRSTKFTIIVCEELQGLSKDTCSVRIS